MKTLLFISLITLVFGLKGQNTDSNTVYVFQTSEYYHQAHCSQLTKENKTLTLKQAKEKGYTACKICHPTKRSASGEPNTRKRHTTTSETSKQRSQSKKPSSTTRSNRCQATTQKGHQCKRRVKGGSYCWQHR